MRAPPSTALPLAALLAACLAGCHQEKPPPSIDVLDAALRRSAEQTLPAPTLASEQVSLSVPPAQADARAAEIIEAASAAGGAAIRSPEAGGRTSILATIPENNVDAFKAATRHEKAAMEKPFASTRLIEVLLENQPVPSPSP